jgi:hypothetical protein
MQEGQMLGIPGIHCKVRIPGWSCEPLGDDHWFCSPPQPQIASLAFEDRMYWKENHPDDDELESRHFWFEAERKILAAKTKEIEQQ